MTPKTDTTDLRTLGDLAAQMLAETCEDCDGRGNLGRIGGGPTTEGLKGRIAECEKCHGDGEVKPDPEELVTYHGMGIIIEWMAERGWEWKGQRAVGCSEASFQRNTAYGPPGDGYGFAEGANLPAATITAALRAEGIRRMTPDEINERIAAWMGIETETLPEHQWRRDENGKIDQFGLDIERHNGPKCVRCHESYCQHCQDAPDNPKCEPYIPSYTASLDAQQPVWEALGRCGFEGPAVDPMRKEAVGNRWFVRWYQDGPTVMERGDDLTEAAARACAAAIEVLDGHPR